MRSQVAAVLTAAVLLATGCEVLFVDREQELRDLADAGTQDAGTSDAGVLPPPPPTDPTALTVTNWNVEYFGDPEMGPGDEVLQQWNVASVLRTTVSDLWALQEIASPQAFEALTAGMTGFGAVLVSDPEVEGSEVYSSGFAVEVGVIYRTSRLTLLDAKVILAEHDFEFAGRPPLELTFRVRDTGRELVVITLHLKAQYPSSCTDCWERRRNAAALLKTYLDETRPAADLLVLGDWNDDVDESIVSGFDTPFRSFVSDSTRYRFVTDVLSARSEGSTVRYTSTIDHQLVSDELVPRLRPGSTIVIHPEVSDYERTTTDHYPVQSQFLLTE